MEIQVLGAGCARCKSLVRVTEEALASLGIHAAVEKVEDYPRIVAAGVMHTPALVIDGTVRLSGRVPGKAEVIGLLSAASAARNS